MFHLSASVVTYAFKYVLQSENSVYCYCNLGTFHNVGKFVVFCEKILTKLYEIL